MGANQSTPGLPSGAKVAFNVLRVSPNSPASRAALVPYFDYILAVNGITVIQEIPNVVAEMAKTHLERPVRMSVYNSRNDTLREVTIVPSSKWGGDGLLGCSIRFTPYERAIDRDTAPDSPGFKAGLVPLKDWIVGSADMALHSEDDFYQLLIHNKKRPVRLVVFNLDQNGCREVSVVPDFEWGGDGCLGCDIGTGVLNRIPIDEAGIIPNVASGEKDSLLAGQGLLKDSVDINAHVVSPGHAAKVPVSSCAGDGTRDDAANVQSFEFPVDEEHKGFSPFLEPEPLTRKEHNNRDHDHNDDDSSNAAGGTDIAPEQTDIHPLFAAPASNNQTSELFK